jgi:Retinal pigment epithelial membrane protein
MLRIRRCSAAGVIPPPAILPCSGRTAVSPTPISSGTAADCLLWRKDTARSRSMRRHWRRRATGILPARSRARFTAHPKIDPETGEMIFFAYSAAGHFSPTLGYGVIDSTGKLTRPAVPLRPVLRLRGPLVRFRRGGLWRTDGPAAGATGSGRAPQSAGAPVPAVSFAEISKYVEQNAEKLKATARFARIGRGFTTHTLE